MNPIDLVLTVAFVALLIGLPSFTWWETGRAYRRAAAILDVITASDVDSVEVVDIKATG